MTSRYIDMDENNINISPYEYQSPIYQISIRPLLAVSTSKHGDQPASINRSTVRLHAFFASIDPVELTFALDLANIVARKPSGDAIKRTLPPAAIDHLSHCDDVALLEAQLKTAPCLTVQQHP